MEPRGLRNNNPLNIRQSRDHFQGEVVPSQDRSFKQFSSMAYGYRAAFVILASYLACGRNTVEKIIRAWAPPTENNTEGYIAHVVQRSGVGRNKVLTAESGGDYRKIVGKIVDQYSKLAAAIERIDKKANVIDAIEVFTALNRWLEARMEWDGDITPELLAQIERYQDLYISEQVKKQ